MYSILDGDQGYFEVPSRIPSFEVSHRLNSKEHLHVERIDKLPFIFIMFCV